MVRFIRQGEKRRGERRTFRTKEQLCGEQRLGKRDSGAMVRRATLGERDGGAMVRRATAVRICAGAVRWRGERRNYRAKE